MGKRNPILVVGDPPRKGVTWMTDELIRVGAHDNILGSDGFLLMAFLLSCASTPSPTRRPYETSAAAISENFGWGANRRRATKAIEAAVKDHRLVVREYLRDGQLVARRCAYLVCAGGRRFTDDELVKWDRPIELPSNGTCTTKVQHP